MNKNALKGKARQGRVTKTGKAPNNVGFPGGNVSGGGVIRKLTPKEIDAQRKLGAFIIVNGKPFNGLL